MSELLYIMTPNCGWCKKSDPVVAELIKDGYKITTLDMTKPDEAKRANEAKAKYQAQCGTPLFLDADTGNMGCGFKEKDILEKWAKGEKLPAPPPRPQQQPQGNVPPGSQRPAPMSMMDMRKFRLGIWQEAKQVLTEKFQNDYEVWDKGQVKKRPTYPTTANIHKEAEKILEFIK